MYRLTVNWLKIKVFRLEKNSRFVRFKYGYDDDFSTIGVSGRGRHSATKSRLPITAAKKMDLLSLCKTGVVPNEHHHFFKNLQSSKKDADCGDSE